MVCESENEPVCSACSIRSFQKLAYGFYASPRLAGTSSNTISVYAAGTWQNIQRLHGMKFQTFQELLYNYWIKTFIT
jgi:hypothetical protein